MQANGHLIKELEELMVRTASLAALPIFVLLIGTASVFTQNIPNTDLPNAFLDASFEQKQAFIDDVQINEIRLKNKKNIKIAAIENISDFPLNIAILLDASGSQRVNWNLVSQFYIKMIESMPLRKIDSVCLISANQNINVVQGPTPDKTLLIKGFSSLICIGGTRLLDAIYFVGKNFDNQSKSRNAMIVITDGVDKDSSTKIEAAYKTAIANNVRIYLYLTKENENIGSLFYAPKTDYVAIHKKYGTKTGGKVFSFSDLKSGRDQIMRMLDELNHLQRIKFSTDDPKVLITGFEISVSRKGVKAYYPSPLK
jgi:hypothetical protein